VLQTLKIRQDVNSGQMVLNSSCHVLPCQLDWEMFGGSLSQLIKMEGGHFSYLTLWYSSLLASQFTTWKWLWDNLCLEDLSRHGHFHQH